MLDLGGPPFDSERAKPIAPSIAKIREGFSDLGFKCQGLTEFGIGTLGFQIPLTVGKFRVMLWHDLMNGACVDVQIRRGTTKDEDGSSLHFTKRLED